MVANTFKIHITYIFTLRKLVKFILSLDFSHYALVEILCILSELIAGRYAVILSF
jgi:hypothetical protein